MAKTVQVVMQHNVTEVFTMEEDEYDKFVELVASEDEDGDYIREWLDENVQKVENHLEQEDDWDYIDMTLLEDDEEVENANESEN